MPKPVKERKSLRQKRVDLKKRRRNWRKYEKWRTKRIKTLEKLIPKLENDIQRAERAASGARSSTGFSGTGVSSYAAEASYEALEMKAREKEALPGELRQMQKKLISELSTLLKGDGTMIVHKTQIKKVFKK